MPVRAAASKSLGAPASERPSSLADSNVTESDDWADAEPFAPPVAPPPGDDDSGPPLEAMEAQMRAELAGRNGRAPVRSKPARGPDEEQENPPAVLPALDTLIARLPDDVRATLEELFRVRFQAVRQIPRKALVTATGNPLT